MTNLLPEQEWASIDLQPDLNVSTGAILEVARCKMLPEFIELEGKKRNGLMLTT
jgi:hypothetical protein